MSENQQGTPEKKRGLPPGMGMVIGVAIGIIIGLLYGFLIIGQVVKRGEVGSIFGISMGIGVGIAIGAILDQTGRKPMPTRKLLKVIIWLIIILFLIEMLSVYIISIV